MGAGLKYVIYLHVSSLVCDLLMAFSTQAF